MRVLIAPDKFKGTLTASQAARAIARGWQMGRPGDQVRLLPISDGGDGFGLTLGALLQARLRIVRTVNAAHQPVTARWWWEPRTRTGLVESAGVIGLAMLPAGRFHPFQLDTFGLGAVLERAARHGCRRCLVGLGGSATNDGGFGLARALGWEFLDGRGRLLSRWTELHRLAELRRPRGSHLGTMKVTVAVDVRNLLLGRRGATRVYGPQKGLRPSDFRCAERALARLARVFGEQYGRDPAAFPGSGAAGGLGFGLAAFLGAGLRPGFEVFARQVRLERHLRVADLVITGEGALDHSTLMGKGVGELARKCRARGIPCLALAGTATPTASLRRAFTDIQALVPDLTTEAEAKARPAKSLMQLGRISANSLK